MNIGIIEYSEYEERVPLNQHFVIDNLFRIVQEDETYRAFHIVDGEDNVLLSTVYDEAKKNIEFLYMAKIEKDVELIGTDYYAFRTPSTKHKYKTTWKVNGGICRGKKDAEQYAERINSKARLLIEKYLTKL